MWIASLAVLALVFSFFAQFFWGIQPCVLCWYQRGFLAVLAVISLLRWNGLTRLVLVLGLFLAFYQVGVEQHLWKHPGCVDSGPSLVMEGRSQQEQYDLLKEYTDRPMTIGCDHVTWRILGLSASIWTVFLYIIMNGVALYGCGKHASRRSRW